MPPPRHKYIDKIYNASMHNNRKIWLAIYLSGRKGHVNFNGIPSKIRPFGDGVPQGSVLSPSLFSFFSTTSQHPPFKTPKSYPMQMLNPMDRMLYTTPMLNTTQLPQTLNTLQTWLTTNRLKVAPDKSTASLITNYKQE